RLCFEDNGIGIEEAAQRRLFEMFQRMHTGSEYEGTGIGLAIVRKSAERMRGQAGLESAVGRGSLFWVELAGVDSWSLISYSCSRRTMRMMSSSFSAPSTRQRLRVRFRSC